MGNVGSPAELMNNITSEEVLRPVVGKTARMIKARKINSRRKYRKSLFGADLAESSDEESDEEVSWKDIQVVDVSLSEINPECVESVTVELQDLCKSFAVAFETRFTEDEVVTAALDVFASDFSWCRVRVEDGEGGSLSLNSGSSLSQDSDSEENVEESESFEEDARDRITMLINKLPEASKYEYWQFRNNCVKQEVTEGYLNFARFCNSEKSIEDNYEDFCCTFKDKFRLFKSLFERVQIKGFSESFCETVGMSLIEIIWKQNSNSLDGDLSLNSGLHP